MILMLVAHGEHVSKYGDGLGRDLPSGRRTIWRETAINKKRTLNTKQIYRVAQKTENMQRFVY